MSKLTKYCVRQGKTEKNGTIYPWTSFEFYFQGLDGKEVKVCAFPKNSGMLVRLLGFTDDEIIVENEIRHK